MLDSVWRFGPAVHGRLLIQGSLDNTAPLNTQVPLDFYAKVAGQHFDEGNGNAFNALSNGQQTNDITGTLAAGETSSGWLAFDVPRPHGFIVYAPNFDGQPLAEWKF